MSEPNIFFNNFQTDLFNSLNCCMLGRITEFNEDRRTISAQPLQQYYYNNQFQNFPIISNIPLMYYDVGNYRIVSNPSINDIVILFITDYDISNLLVDGETVQPNTRRMHNITDCLALPYTFNNFNNKFAAVDGLEIINTSNNASFKITSSGDININTSGDVNINCNKYTLTETNP